MAVIIIPTPDKESTSIFRLSQKCSRNFSLKFHHDAVRRSTASRGRGKGRDPYYNSARVFRAELSNLVYTENSGKQSSRQRSGETPQVPILSTTMEPSGCAPMAAVSEMGQGAVSSRGYCLTRVGVTQHGVTRGSCLGPVMFNIHNTNNQNNHKPPTKNNNPKTAWDLISESSLRIRSARVKQHGVPQGSCLGPVMFNIHQ
ncbi:hypothetical protein J6590_025083 [Homalodisca vitripennis]|nr:hypothetical protein J6590_025083 [Homalodisca vitripennis]